MSATWYNEDMVDTESLYQRFTVRDVNSRIIQLMRIAAVRMRMTQGEAVEAALMVWLKSLKYSAASRFQDLDREIEEL